MPETSDQWKKIGKEFEDKWQFPHCLGAVDGKHIAIVAPRDSGSYYWNYKQFNSVVLMACADADYKIIWCEVGINGRISDGGVIKQTRFYEKLCSKTLGIPDEEPVATGTILPYVFIGDEAFALRPDFIKPYSQQVLTPQRRIYNYRVSRARRIIENVFGIMASRFKILQTPINLPVVKVDLIILTICALHNFLRTKCSTYISPEDMQQDQFNHELTALQVPTNAHNSDRTAKEAREAFEKYFNGEGAVEWQSKYAN